MNELPAAGVMRVVGPESIGAGFIVTAGGLVVTCAHVLAGSARGATVRVEPHAGRQLLEATVVLLENPPDVAVLQLTAEVPREAAVLPLGRSPRDQDRRHGLLTFGYPRVRPETGLPGEVTIIPGDTADDGYRQLTLDSNQATLGFSGAPIWDPDRGAVVGMVKGIVNEDPGQRLKSAGLGVPAEVIRELYPELRLPAGCPYRGLEPFTEEHADYYCGREHATGQLLAGLAARDFVAVVAVSGGGKSSLLQAGLAKGLRDRPVAGLAQRVRCFQRVGSRPHAELLDCLAAHGMSLPRELATAPPSKVAAAVLGAAPPAGLIMVADQFERLYTECADAERKRFTELLLRLATDTVKVVIGLRADFYHLALADLGEHLAAGQVALAPMGEHDLGQAIVEPAGRLLRSLQPGLALRITTDVRGRPGDLPLLQFALTQLWERDEAGGVLTEETYRGLGAVLEDGTHLPGAQGALIHRAEELWRDLSLSDRTRLRRILLGLIAAQPAATSADHLAGSLRDLSRPALRAQWDDDDQQLIQQLIDARLLTADGAAADGRATIEVSHEALLRAWPRLRSWLEGRGTYVQWRAQDLAPNLERWLNSKKNPGSKGNPEFLLPPSLLDPALRWLNGYPDELAGPPAAYIQASKRRRASRTRIRQGITAALAALAVGLAVTTVAAYNASEAAASQRDDAIASQLITESEAQTDTNPTASKIESLVAWHIDPSPQSRYALISAAASPAIALLADRDGSANSVAFSPDGRTLAAGSAYGTVLWDVATHRQIGQLTDTNDIVTVAFSPDGRTLATGDGFGTVRLWDVATHKQIGQPITSHTNVVNTVANTVAFSPDGQTLVISAGNELVLWDVATHRQTGRPITAVTNFGSVAFSPNGKTLATGTGNGGIRLWDVATHRQIGLPFTASDASTTSPVNSVAFSPNGKTLATGTDDGTVLWDVATHQQIGQPLTTGTVVNAVAFSPNGKTLATGGQDGTARLWDVSAQQLIGQPLTTGTTVSAVAFSPDGKTLATGTVDGTVRLWDVARLGSLSLTTGTNITSVAFSPDGQTLVTGSANGTAQLWKVATRPLVSHPPTTGTSDNNVDPVAFSPDGRTVVAANSHPGGTVGLWDAATHRQIGRPFSVGDYSFEDVAFSPDGRAIAAGALGNTVRLLDIATRRQIGAPFLAGPFVDTVTSVAFSPDGRTLATGDNNGTVRLWDVATQQQIGPPLTDTAIAASGQINAVTFTPDGQILAAASTNGVQLWNVSAIDQAFMRVCGQIGGPITRAEWTQDVPAGPAYSSVCR